MNIAIVGAAINNNFVALCSDGCEDARRAADAASGKPCLKNRN